MAATTSATTRFKLVFFVPVSHLETCKRAVFDAGAGRYPGPGQYTECCWTVIGDAQFRPGKTANPHIGNVGELEVVEEARVEVSCFGKEIAREAVKALRQ